MRPWQEDQPSTPARRAAAREADGEHALGGPHAGTHAHGHPHDHGQEAGEYPAVGIVGGGAVGRTLAVALRTAGWPVVAVASRDPERREGLRSLVPEANAFETAPELLDEADVLVLAVPDDAIGALAADLRLYSGQVLVHTSGVLDAGVLEPARAAGSLLGAFHPLVGFTADVERSVAALRGATIALDGDEPVMGLLADMAEAVGGVPVRLVPGGRPAYHAAAVLAAGGFVALLDAIAALGRAAGLDEAGSLVVYGRLIEQTLGNARAIGIRAALTGPIVRADIGTIEAHLAALRTLAPGVLELYVAAARREVTLARERGSLSPEQAAAVLASLAKTA